MSRQEPLTELGACPVCGSAEVNAIWYGDPIGNPDDFWPPNVQMGGCSIEDVNRACLQCGHRWLAPSRVDDA